MQQDGTSIGYFITAIGALAAVIVFLGKFFLERLKIADKRLEIADTQLQEERKARTDDTKAFLGQLTDLAQQNREAHEREMSQVLTRLEQSDRISKQQTEILSTLKGKRTPR